MRLKDSEVATIAVAPREEEAPEEDAVSVEENADSADETAEDVKLSEESNNEE